MNYALLGQTLVLAILGGVVAWQLYVTVQELFIRRRTRDSLRTLLDSSPENWAITHRQWLANRRSGLELKLSRDALIDVAVEECEGWHNQDNRTEVDTTPPWAA